MNPNKHWTPNGFDENVARHARDACTAEFAPPDVSVMERAEEARTLIERQRILFEKPLDSIASRACVSVQRLKEIEGGTAQPTALEAVNIGKVLCLPSEFVGKRNTADTRRALNMKRIY